MSLVIVSCDESDTLLKTIESPAVGADPVLQLVAELNRLSPATPVQVNVAAACAKGTPPSPLPTPPRARTKAAASCCIFFTGCPISLFSSFFVFIDMLFQIYIIEYVKRKRLLAFWRH